MKTLIKILASTFLSALIIQLAWSFLLFPSQTLAADDIKFTPQVGIPGAGDKFGPGSTYTFDKKSTQPIAEYIQSIYKYAIAVVGILATMTMMLGGVMWIVSGGSAERAGEAKAWISASLTGLLLTILSYLILATVNPALTNFKISSIPNVTDLGCCYNWTDASHIKVQCDALTKIDCERAGRTFYAASCSDTFYCTASISCSGAASGDKCITSSGGRGYCLINDSACYSCIESDKEVTFGWEYRCCDSTPFGSGKCR